MHSFLKGFLVGLCASAAVALLLSPRKGAENRDLVRQRVQQALEAGRQAALEQDGRLRGRFRQAIGVSEEKEPTQS
jgi:gas vesicle protein